jgi:hypothetical protein
MNFLQKIQNLPEGKRKIILWFLVVVIGILLFSFYFKYIGARISNFNMGGLKEGLKIDELKKNLENMPGINLQLPSNQATTSDGQEPEENLPEGSSSSPAEILLN